MSSGNPVLKQSIFNLFSFTTIYDINLTMYLFSSLISSMVLVIGHLSTLNKNLYILRRGVLGNSLKSVK